MSKKDNKDLPEKFLEEVETARKEVLAGQVTKYVRKTSKK